MVIIVIIALYSYKDIDPDKEIEKLIAIA